MGTPASCSRLKLAGIIKTEAPRSILWRQNANPPQARWNHQDRSRGSREDRVRWRTASSSLESSRPKQPAPPAASEPLNRLKLAGIIKTEADEAEGIGAGAGPPQARWNHQDRSRRCGNRGQIVVLAASSSLESSRPKRASACAGFRLGGPPQARWNHQDRSNPAPLKRHRLNRRLKLAGIIKTEA